MCIHVLLPRIIYRSRNVHKLRLITLLTDNESLRVKEEVWYECRKICNRGPYPNRGPPPLLLKNTQNAYGVFKNEKLICRSHHDVVESKKSILSIVESLHYPRYSHPP